MSRKTEKSKKRDIIKKRKQLRLARKKKQEDRKAKRSSSKKAKSQMINNLVGQLKQQEKPTFDRSMWQTSESSNNTPHGSVRSAVLNSKKTKVGAVAENAGFNLTAWAPPDGKDTEEITTVDSGECSEGIGE